MCTILDLFNTNAENAMSVRKLIDSDFKNVVLNYMTWDEYKQALSH